ncbi:MAG TPA: hypothetical protein ENK75_06690, partial [Saprospiraceae bacterium]|nr:hypothetical protein [Saprospiraceae bacterium]
MLFEIQNKVQQILQHPKLKNFFSEEVTVYNEREIVTVDGQIIIPDRLVINNKNEVTILDYKTGVALKKHHQQILNYQNVLKSMNYKVKKLYLIYIGAKIIVEQV